MTDIKRRKFVTMVGASAAVVPLAAMVASLPSHAQDLPEVDPGSAAAKGLQYVAESEKGDANCSSCILYTGADGDDLGGCPLFQGSSVRASAWCSAYVPKG